MRFFFIILFQIFKSFSRTKGIVSFCIPLHPFSIIRLAQYILMTSLTQGRSRPCRAGDESLQSLQASRNQKACSGEPNLCLHLPRQMLCNMDTDERYRCVGLTESVLSSPSFFKCYVILNRKKMYCMGTAGEFSIICISLNK